MTSFSSLDGIGSNIHVVGLDDLTSLYNSSFPIEENEWSGLPCESCDIAPTSSSAISYYTPIIH